MLRLGGGARAWGGASASGRLRFEDQLADDVAALQAEIAAFHAKRSDVEAVLANIRTWSNRDQLGLGAVFPAPGPPQ